VSSRFLLGFVWLSTDILGNWEATNAKNRLVKRGEKMVKRGENVVANVLLQENCGPIIALI